MEGKTTLNFERDLHWRLHWRLLAALFGFVALSNPTLNAVTPNWPQFRGPNCSGVAEKGKPPVQISPTNNVLWKMDVPWSPSSPCIWGDRIFLATLADGDLQTRCYSRKDGKWLWSRSIKPDKLEMFHRSEGSPAASTPATDGKHVVCYFGSFGLVCYNLEGGEMWRRPLPIANSGGSFGTGTSPVIAGKLVILNRDQDENSSLLAVDIQTGKTVWESARPDAIGSFGTPILWRQKAGDEIVMPGSEKLKGYDPKTGQERWVVDGLVGFSCTTPVVGDGMLFFAGWSPGKSDQPWPTWEQFLARNNKSGDDVIVLAEMDESKRDFMRGLDRNKDGKLSKEDWDLITSRAAKANNLLVAVKPGGNGDITQTHVAWKATRGLPYVPSPLFYQGRVYLIKDGGMMSSFDASSGKEFYLQERIEPAENYYASPVAADGRIYLASLPGRVTVVKAGGEAPQVLYQANFGERIFATPAIVGDNLYLRTAGKLYAFGNKK